MQIEQPDALTMPTTFVCRVNFTQRFCVVLSLEAAQQPGAPQIHGKAGNRKDDPKVYTRGDVQEGFQEATVVIDQVYTTPTQVHNSLELHGCTAFWQGDQLTIWESTQGIFEVREQVAQKLGLPEHHVRIVKEHMGAEFSSKQIAWKQTAIASLLSQRSSHPVQFMLDREGENLADGSRGATRQHVHIGAKRDGTLAAIAVEAQIANGAYSVGGEAADVSGLYQRLYRCPNLYTEQVAIYTNMGPSVAFRDPGHVEAAFAIESAMDEVACALGMDPLQLRLHNYAENDQKKEKPYSSPTALRLCYERVTSAFGWQSYQRPKPQGSRRRGIGFAAHDCGGGGNPPAYAWVKINGDGTADVITGAQDIGTGSRTGLLLVAAEELGLPVHHVTVHLGDTAVGPYAPTSAGSATQVTAGPAVRAEAADAKRQLLEAAAQLLEEDDPTQLQIHDRIVKVKGNATQQVTVKEVAGRLAPHMILGQGMRGANSKDVSIRTFGAQCIEVEVEMTTGEITLLRVAAAHDCGRIINPTTVESQIIGGVTQGIGFALIEERVLDPHSGIVLNANLEEYKVPTVADVPPIMHVAVDLPDTVANPTGAKGIGEPPLIPTAPAIANAIFDATGIRIRQAPISRRALLAALKKEQPHG